MRRLVVSTLMASTLAFTLGGPEAPVDPVEPILECMTATNDVCVTDAEQATIRQGFESAQRYWIRQGLGEAASIGLVILQRDDTFPCPIAKSSEVSLSAADQGQAHYCETSNTVVIDAAMIRGIVKEYPSEMAQATLDLISRHEFGHGVQDVRGEIPNFIGAPYTSQEQILADTRARRRVEQQADCYAGATMADADDGDIQAAAAVMRSLVRPDPNHGTAQQRHDSFMEGVLTQECSQPTA